MSHGKRTMFIWFRVGCHCPKTTCISAIKPPVFLFCGCLLVTLEFYLARTAAELSARMMRSMPSVDVETHHSQAGETRLTEVSALACSIGRREDEGCHG